MTERAIRASELRSFSFCRRAWFLERQGYFSTLKSERARGVSDHRKHGAAVRYAATVVRIGSALAILALAALAVAVLL